MMLSPNVSAEIEKVDQVKVPKKPADESKPQQVDNVLSESERASAAAKLAEELAVLSKQSLYQQDGIASSSNQTIVGLQ